MQPFELTAHDALAIILKNYRRLFDPDIPEIEYHDQDWFNLREPGDVKGHGVYLFFDHCDPERPKDEFRGHENYTVIRNIGQTRVSYLSRFKDKSFSWQEVGLIRIPFLKGSRHNRHVPALCLESHLLERIRCSHNWQRQDMSQSTDVFVTTRPIELEAQLRDKYRKTFENPTYRRLGRDAAYLQV